MTCAKQATTCTSGTTRVQFTHDALDRARTRVNSGTTTTYTYTGVSEQVARTVAGSVTTNFASTASGAPMAQKVGSAAASYHLLDTHSDVVGLVSTAAANVGTTAYDAYGGVLGTTGTQGTLGFQGDITDPTTKQVDMGTRWYAPGQGRFTSRDSMFGEIDSPMSLNQFAYGAMNPVTMSDPTGMMPHCAFDCTPQQQQHLVSTWSQSYGETVQAGTGGSGYSPGTLAQASAQPVQAITYVRETSDYAVPDVCARRCGDGSFGSIATGTLDADAFEDVQDEDCGRFGWRCWDNTVINAGGRLASELPDVALNLALPSNGVDLVPSYDCGNDRVNATCYEDGPSGWAVGKAGYGGVTMGNTINCSGSCEPISNHELVHVAQYQEDGFSFVTRWVVERISLGYCSIGYEIEARDLGGGQC